jgi:hypothetical protein
VTPDGPYDVSGFLDVFAEISIDGGPFTPGQMRFANVEATTLPEPSSVLLLLTGVAGVLAAARLRFSNRRGE